MAGLASRVHANSQKIIFSAPPASQVPESQSSLSALTLYTLTPDRRTLRIPLQRSPPPNEHFGKGPSHSVPTGLDSWFLLDALRPDQRHELRVNWAATQPTEFEISGHTADEVFAMPNLLAELSEYVDRQVPHPGLADRLHASSLGEGTASSLFVKVRCAADYYTVEGSLMEKPPPVLVDLILDPYAFNVVPESLLPVIGYITVLVIVAWLISQWVWRWLDQVKSEKTRERKSHVK